MSRKGVYSAVVGGIVGCNIALLYGIGAPWWCGLIVAVSVAAANLIGLDEGSRL